LPLKSSSPTFPSRHSSLLSRQSQFMLAGYDRSSSVGSMYEIYSISPLCFCYVNWFSAIQSNLEKYIEILLPDNEPTQPLYVGHSLCDWPLRGIAGSAKISSSPGSESSPSVTGYVPSLNLFSLYMAVICCPSF
jgi:hypothetical protein